jgi:RHS repeat-associated protein
MVVGDQKNTLLSEIINGQVNAVAHTAYGYPTGEQPIKAQLRYNGEFNEPQTGTQLLGNGYRAYNFALMRFQSPDSLSPFGAGGVNTYAYCEGEPVLNVDPDGHSVSVFSWLKQMLLNPNRKVTHLNLQQPNFRSSVSSVSGGPSRDMIDSPPLKLYGKKGVTRSNPLYDGTESDLPVLPSVTFNGESASPGEYGSGSGAAFNHSNTVSYGVDSVVPQYGHIRERPRHPLPNEQTRHSLKQSVIKVPAQTPQEIGQRQQNIRDQKWLERRERDMRRRKERSQ